MSLSDGKSPESKSLFHGNMSSNSHDSEAEEFFRKSSIDPSDESAAEPNFNQSNQNDGHIIYSTYGAEEKAHVQQEGRFGAIGSPSFSGFNPMRYTNDRKDSQKEIKNAPRSSNVIPPSPVSATKFIERSLHDLDDLIHKRRMELLALRESNRIRLLESYRPGQTPPNKERSKSAGHAHSSSVTSSPAPDQLQNQNSLSGYARQPLSTSRVGGRSSMVLDRPASQEQFLTDAVSSAASNSKSSECPSGYISTSLLTTPPPKRSPMDGHLSDGTRVDFGRNFPASGTVTDRSMAGHEHDGIVSAGNGSSSRTSRSPNGSSPQGIPKELYEELRISERELARKLREESSRCASLEASNRTLERQCADLQASKRTASNDLMRLHELSAGQAKELASLKEELTAARDEIATAQSAGLLSSLAEKTATLEQAMQTIDDLSARITELDGQVRSEKLHKLQYAQSLAESDSARRDLESDVKKAAESAFEWERHAAAINAHFVGLMADAQQKQENQELQIAVLEAELKRKEEEEQQQQGRVTGLDIQNRDREQLILQLQDDLQRANQLRIEAAAASGMVSTAAGTEGAAEQQRWSQQQREQQQLINQLEEKLQLKERELWDIHQHYQQQQQQQQQLQRETWPTESGSATVSFQSGFHEPESDANDSTSINHSTDRVDQDGEQTTGLAGAAGRVGDLVGALQEKVQQQAVEISALEAALNEARAAVGEKEQMLLKGDVMLQEQDEINDRLVYIVKSWIYTCDRAWEHALLRKVFDLLRVNRLFERLRKAYQQKCVMYIQQEEMRVRELIAAEAVRFADAPSVPGSPTRPQSHTHTVLSSSSSSESLDLYAPVVYNNSPDGLAVAARVASGPGEGVGPKRRSVSIAGVDSTDDGCDQGEDTLDKPPILTRSNRHDEAAHGPGDARAADSSILDAFLSDERAANLSRKDAAIFIRNAGGDLEKALQDCARVYGSSLGAAASTAGLRNRKGSKAEKPVGVSDAGETRKRSEDEDGEVRERAGARCSIADSEWPSARIPSKKGKSSGRSYYLVLLACLQAIIWMLVLIAANYYLAEVKASKSPTPMNPFTAINNRYTS